jgi:hypothetical protein
MAGAMRRMAVDLVRMLERCRQGQWSVDDFDWSRAPIPLGCDREAALCAYYVNMSYIERLAGALFRSLSERLDDPLLQAIFATFAADELRHSHAAARLADYFDVHHHRVYTPNVAMLRFIPYFAGMIESLSPSFAISFILGGELILDLALLRGLNTYVDDPLARAVVERINQDESRHLAMDMYLTEHFARAAAGSTAATTSPWTNADFWGVAAWGPAFFTGVFFRPMQTLDPTHEQMREVMRRLRRFYDRPAVDGNPAVEQFRTIVAFFETGLGSLVGRALEDGIRWASGVDLAFVRARGDTASPEPALARA